MTKNRKVSLALGLGSLTAAVALLAGLSQANAQAPAPGTPLSGAGSFPQSFIVPGTNTSLHVGGFLQMDVSYDMGAFGNATSLGALDNLAPMSVGVEGPNGAGNHTDHGVMRWSAQSSRFLVETRTPTSYGELKTFIEVDFAGSMSAGGVNGLGNTSAGTTQTNFNTQSIVRAKQAYGTLGPWLFGEANSNYADLAAIPDTLDGFVEAGITIGAGNVKTPQVRYTYLLPMGMSVSGALESFQTGGVISGAAGAGPITLNNFNSPGFVQKFPAATITAQIQQPWGHAGFHVAVAESRLKDLGGAAAFPPGGLGAVGSHVESWGYQLSQTGHFNTIGKDKISWMLEYGHGAGMYAWGLNQLGTQWVEDLICTTNAATIAASTSVTCAQTRNWGGNVGYSHWWTDELRSGVSLGYDHIPSVNNTGTYALASAGLNAIDRNHISAVGNVLWTPVAGAQFGLEYEWYHRRVQSGASGSSNRIKFQSLFAF